MNIEYFQIVSYFAEGEAAGGHVSISGWRGTHKGEPDANRDQRRRYLSNTLRCTTIKASWRTHGPTQTTNKQTIRTPKYNSVCIHRKQFGAVGVGFVRTRHPNIGAFCPHRPAQRCPRVPTSSRTPSHNILMINNYALSREVHTSDI